MNTPPMLWVIYNLIFPVGFLLMLPYYLFRMCRRGGYWRDFEQRLGIYSSGVQAMLLESPRIWVHSVSVGEILVAFSFMEEYRRQHPGARFVLTTNTSTAHGMARKRMDERDVLLYFPVDLPWVIHKVLNCIQPEKLVLVECEIWPNLIRQAARRGVEVCLVNGRLSDHSYKGYMKLRMFTRPVMRLFSCICAQGEQDRRRFIDIGAAPEKTHRLGAAKYDVAREMPELTESIRTMFLRLGIPKNAFIVVAASTWPGEEAAVLEAYASWRRKFDDLFLVLVPRHFERGPELEQLFKKLKLNALHYSEVKAGSLGFGRPDLLFVDTVGELMGFYACADIVFIGKSLEPNHGGQNPIEPALLGCPVIVGPNMENFPSIMDEMLADRSLIQISGKSELEPVVARLLFDPQERAEQGARAAASIRNRQGVMKETVRTVAGNAP